VPPLPPGIDWVGGPEPRLDLLLARGPALVHFFDFAQLNSVRALPYVGAWRSRYADHGLAVLGVHSPRFPFSRDAAAVASALPELEVDWPVAVDADHAIWRGYGCRGWPSLFLWGQGGALRWYHLGEGDYEATEGAIRESLGAPPEQGWPEPVAPLRPGDEAGAKVIAPTPEVFPGGSPEAAWEAGGEALGTSYEAGGVYAAVDPAGASESPARLTVAIDGEPPRELQVGAPGLIELVIHPRHESHRLQLGGSAGLRVHSLQFSPAPA